MGLFVKFQFGASEVAVNIANRASLLAVVMARLRAKQGFALATINLDHLVKLKTSSKFRHDYAAQDLIVADGNPIVWLSYLARRPVSLVPGSDLVTPLARVAAEAKVPIALVGSTQKTLDAAAGHLMRTIPGLTVALCHAPAMGFDPDGAEAVQILETLGRLGSGLCFVALGAPKQEAFAAHGRVVAPHMGFASVGAGLDFIAGSQTRAPGWVRSIAMEWAWRAMTSPIRLIPRYAACAAILPSQIVGALKLRFE